jgi:hypothetical protein
MITAFISVTFLYLFTHRQGPDLCLPTSWPLILTQRVSSTLKLETAPSSKLWVPLVKSTWCHILQDSDFHILYYVLGAFCFFVVNILKFCIKWVETCGYAGGSESLWLGVWPCLVSDSDFIRYYAYLCSRSRSCGNVITWLSVLM